MRIAPGRTNHWILPYVVTRVSSHPFFPAPPYGRLTSLAVIPSISLNRAVAGMKTVRSMMTVTMARMKAMMAIPILSMPDFWMR